MTRYLLLGALALPLAVAAAPFDHRHAAWTALLDKHVVLLDGGKASRVRYAGFARDRAALGRYLDALSGVSEAQFAGWTKPQQAAFLINAYNAFMIEKVLQRYPDIGSVWDFGKLFGNPFRDRFFRLLGREASLDRVEHELLRRPGAYNEPRVHYAVNCASIGCPMLREEAYVGERLEEQLEQQEARFLSDGTRNRWSALAGALEVSRIYDWYGEDWTRGYRGIGGALAPINSLAQYFASHAKLLADEAAGARAIAAGQVKIRFLEYDWTLNEAR